MTEETKKLFCAPWTFKYQVHEGWGTGFELCATDGMGVAVSPTEEHANRLARLPELYDALMHFVVNDCPHAFISNDECRLCPDKKCKTREIIELLQKVRDGK
jgi:hypothetical protein